MPEITAAVINWNSGPRLGGAVDALRAAGNVQVVVVDNASSDESLNAVEALDDTVRVIENTANAGFAGAINQAFEITDTPFVLILNPDARARSGAIEALREVFDRRPRAGAVGGFVNDGYLPRPFPTISGLVRENLGLPPRRIRPHDSDIMRVDQPAGAALMVRRAAFDAVGGFDEQFYPVWYEDVDFCRRLADAGWEAYFHPGAVFDHEGGYSMAALGYEQFMTIYYDNQFRYALKHLGRKSVPALKASLVFGLLAKSIVRPHRIAGHWRVLRHVLRHR